MAVLTPEDKQHLDAHYPDQWQVLGDVPGGLGVLIQDFPLPVGYEPERASLLVLLPPGYPNAKLDMFFLNPPVRRNDGQGIGALTQTTHFGQEWQRWSRHYSWQPGVHCLATHLQYAENTMRSELG